MLKNKNLKTFSEAINEALAYCLKKNKNTLCYGLGVGDPKEIFNTTKNLQKKFGSQRVFDIPTSENALTGVAIGAAINGCNVIMTHQRLDFALLSLDQIINNAAKWHYMYNGKYKVPLTIRLIVGRGWGQGPTHSQALHSIFAHIPGLKVMIPFSPNDAKIMLINAILDPNPVIFIEHRWLHESEGYVDAFTKIPKFETITKLNSGKDLTIVSSSIATKDVLNILNILKKNKINVDLLSLKQVKPLNEIKILNSVKKTGRLIVLDFGPSFLSIASEIISMISIKANSYLRQAPIKIALPDYPVPTSYYLTKKFYPNEDSILKACEKLFNKKIHYKKILRPKYHDIPNKDFNGPF
jgi:pyruvate dehydrogenase E1 component beta subunit